MKHKRFKKWMDRIKIPWWVYQENVDGKNYNDLEQMLLKAYKLGIKHSKEEGDTEKLREAIRNLQKVKGRHNTEIACRKLYALLPENAKGMARRTDDGGQTDNSNDH